MYPQRYGFFAAMLSKYKLPFLAENTKITEPVIINFYDSPQSNGVTNGEIKNQGEQLLQQLTQKLAIKGKQIEELMVQNKLMASCEEMSRGSATVSLYLSV